MELLDIKVHKLNCYFNDSRGINCVSQHKKNLSEEVCEAWVVKCQISPFRDEDLPFINFGLHFINDWMPKCGFVKPEWKP